MDKLYWIVCEEGDLTLFEGRHQARTRGAALKFLKEKIGRRCLRDLVFTITFDVQPIIELGRLGGFTVERPKLEVADEDVAKVIERLRDQNGAWKPLEDGVVEDGNLATLDIQRLEEGEPVGENRPYEIVVGDGEAIPDVEDAVRTLAVGETGDFTVTFPEDFKLAAFG